MIPSDSLPTARGLGARRRLMVAIGVLVIGSALPGCTFGEAVPSAQTSAPTPTAQAMETPASTPTPTAAADPAIAPSSEAAPPPSTESDISIRDTAVDNCVAAQEWEDDGTIVGDRAAATVEQRTVDNRYLVTVPAKSEAVSSTGTVYVDGWIYCYLEPFTLQPVMFLNEYPVASWTMSFSDAGLYEAFLAAPDPGSVAFPD